MAERRMFAKTIVLSDAFLDMPMSARCLYFTLGMLADDEGFVGNAKSIMRQCGASNDDMNVLLAKRYVLGFESGVIVIKHWKLNNYLQSDRVKPTTYLEEKSTLTTDLKGSYTEVENPMYTKCIHSIDKNSIDKSNLNIYIEEEKPAKPTKHKYGEYQNVLLTDEELEKLKNSFPDYEERIKELDEGIELKGYKYKSHYLAILKWGKNRKPKEKKEDVSYDIEKVRARAQCPIEYKRK